MIFIENLLKGLIGIVVLIGVAFLFSNNKKRVNYLKIMNILLK